MPVRPLPCRCLPVFPPLAAALCLGLASAALAQGPSSEPPGRQARQAAAPAKDADLPLRHLTLYSSGVGYFEHAGAVPAGGAATFSFTVEQLNDALKSLLVRGANGSVAVSYPGQEPLEQRLADFGIDIGNASSLPELLKQLRGVELTLDVRGDTQPLTGRLLGVTAEQRVEDDIAFTRHTVAVATDAGLRRVSLDQVDNLRINDAALQDELNKALTLLGSTRKQDSKPLTLSFDQASEQTAVSYLLEMPLWKLSYRLDLTQEEPLLQGWAIVDNTTDTDWDGIGVTLVSGRPVSFVQNLYSPEFLSRPVVQPERYAGLRPQEYGQGMAMREEEEASKLQPARRRNMTPGLGAVPQSAAMEVASDAMALEGQSLERNALFLSRQASSGVAPSAAAGDLGDLFAYAIDQPVTVPRGQSAMLPIVNQNVQAEPLSIYNAQVQPKHPMRGVRLTNTTDLKLDAGPVTVLDDGAYAGDAQLGFLAPGDDRLLSYGLDLEVTVDPNHEASTQLVTARLARGVLILTHSTRYTQTYEARNAAGDERHLLIEHPRHHGRELVQPKPAPGSEDKDDVDASTDGIEKTDALYRFPLTVPAGETAALKVVETEPRTQSIQLARHNADQLAAYAGNGAFPKDVREALEQAVRMQRGIEQTQREIGAIEQQNQAITQEQARLRENMGRLDRDSALYQRYVTKLDAQETQLEDHQERLADLRERLAQQQRELADYLESLGD